MLSCPLRQPKYYPLNSHFSHKKKNKSQRKMKKTITVTKTMESVLCWLTTDPVAWPGLMTSVILWVKLIFSLSADINGK